MRTVQASTLVLLLLLASLSTVLQPASATDTTVTSETTWSGAIVPQWKRLQWPTEQHSPSRLAPPIECWR